MPSQPEIRILDSPDDLFRAAATEFAAMAQASVRANGKFCVALSGGSTPRGLYTLLANRSEFSIPWDKTYFFFGDERHVPPDDRESNYRMAFEAMLAKVSRENIFRIHGEERDPETAALAYENTLREFFHLAPGAFPRFDLILLGIGPDGHTASLFPGTTALEEKNRLVVANWVEKFNSYRITLTLPVLNHAAGVIFLVSGQEKAPILRQILEEREDLPAGRVRPINGRLLWLIDRAAASSLTKIR
jgi:6-phosphogluconolactonase